MDHEVETTQAAMTCATYPEQSPEVEELVRDLIGKIADKWTLLALDLLETRGTLRFGEILRGLPGVSQKMLTKTLRQMECDGLVDRKVHAVIPPRVEYTLTPMGMTLTAAFCGVWMWALQHHEKVLAARNAFKQKTD